MAPHFSAASTPVLLRYSASTGIPTMPDTEPNAKPFGMGLRFDLPNDPATGRRVHTDIVAHSVPAFPVATPDDVLAFFSAIAAAGSDGGATLNAFVAAHPSTAYFLSIPKPTPKALENLAFYALTAYRFTNADGKAVYGRYRVVPASPDGVQALTDEEAATKGPNFLYDGVHEQVHAGRPVVYKLLLQVARDGDVTDDNTVHWPEEGPDAREMVDLGTISLDTLVEETPGHDGSDAADQKRIIFDPVPRLPGIEPSADPLLDLRAAVYLMAGKKRREA